MVHTYRPRDGEMGGRDRRMAGSFLPAHLAYLVKFPVKEIPGLKSKVKGS